MRVGIGLPNSIPGCPGALLPRWAQLAEELGFSSVATIDRLAYPTHDALVSLALCAPVTQRIGLLANIVVGPTRNPYLLAKEAATVQSASGGRLVLGLGVGDRDDDFALAGAPFAGRGRTLDALIATMQRLWEGSAPAGGGAPVVAEPAAVPLLVAGHGEHGIRRAVTFGAGWTAGGLDAPAVAPLAALLRTRWRSLGREGGPRVVALGYFGLGDDVRAEAEAALTAYYARYGSEGPERDIVAGLLRGSGAVQEAVAAYAEAGVDELVLYPAVAHLGQVERLAEALAP